MMTRTLLVRCAPIAIAASAALPAVPGFAQDATAADPVIVLPDVAPPAAPVTTAPVPQIVLPDPEPTAAAPASVRNQPAPRTAVAQREASPAPAATRPQASAPTAAAPAIAAAPIAQDSAAPAPVAAPVLAAPSTVDPLPVTAAPSAATNDDATSEMALAGVLGALGIAAVGGVAFAASRRNRRRKLEREGEDFAYEPAVAADPIVPVAAPVAATPATQPANGAVLATNAPAVSAFGTPVVPTAATPAHNTARANGDPVPLPAEMPATFEERDALLKELVAAEPDRANPFTGLRARARRAKLIMQSLGQDFRDRKPRIDLSEYTNRWPSLRGWQPAAT